MGKEKDREKEDYASEEAGKRREDGGGTPNDMLPDLFRQQRDKD